MISQNKNKKGIKKNENATRKIAKLRGGDAQTNILATRLHQTQNPTHNLNHNQDG